MISPKNSSSFLIFLIIVVPTIARRIEPDYEFLEPPQPQKDNKESTDKSTDDKDPVHKLRIKIQEHVDPSSPIHKYADDDLYILQWLKSNAFNLEIAESKFLDHLAWRRNHSIDKLNDEDWLTFSLDFPMFTDTVDNTGRPCAELWLSDWNIRGAVSKGLSEKLQRWQAHMLETQQKRLFETRRQGNRNVTGAMMIQDFDKFNMLKHGCPGCLPILKEMLRVWEEYYAGIFENVYIVNLGPPFSNFLKLKSKEFTPPAVPDALRPYHFKRDWLPVLDGLLNRNQRSGRFGGTLMRNLKLLQLPEHF